MSAIRQAKQEMVEAGGRAAESFGFSRLLGQIYILLYLAPEPMNLDAQADALGVSKASVSIACRQLEAWGALRKIWKRGDRKDYYQAERDLRRIAQAGVLSAFRKKTHSAGVLIDRCLGLLSEDATDDPESLFIKQQLEQADRYRAKVEAVFESPLLESVLVPEDGSKA